MVLAGFGDPPLERKGVKMKRFGAFLAILAVSMFTIGCNPAPKTGSKTTTTKSEVKTEGGKTIETKTTTSEESKTNK